MAVSCQHLPQPHEVSPTHQHNQPYHAAIISSHYRAAAAALGMIVDGLCCMLTLISYTVYYCTTELLLHCTNNYTGLLSICIDLLNTSIHNLHDFLSITFF